MGGGRGAQRHFVDQRVLAALLFFGPSAMVINELSSRFPEEGGLYLSAKEAHSRFVGAAG